MLVPPSTSRQASTMTWMKTEQPFFITFTLMLCMTYLGFELFYNTYAMISVDEFWFAHSAYQYKDSLPYRDFAPYKTVLGYYLLLIPMLVTHGIIGTLIFVKNTLALLNAICLFAGALWLKRYFSRTAILTSLMLVIASEIMLSYSTNIRVDLLAYWFCFFSCLCLLDRRYLIAGLLIGLGFITSQKSIWFLIASNVALFASPVYRKDILRFNAITLLVIAVYMITWSIIASTATVINSMFYEASAMYSLDWYNDSRATFWRLIILYNPLLFILWPITLISLYIKPTNDKHYDERLFIVLYAFTILLLLIPYKQIFPYYMQITIPVFFMLYAAFFSWVFAYLSERTTLTYVLSKQLVMIIAIFAGAIYPFGLFAAKMMGLKGDYQKANLHTVNSILQTNDDYIAGIDLIYTRTQPIAGLKHLMGPAIDYLYYPSEKIRPVMLASLYEDPTVTAQSVVTALKESNVKLYINNYRMDALPPTIKQYLRSQYEHLWGSIYLYAPRITKGKQSIHVKFTGNYLIESASPNRILLNGKLISLHSIRHLTKGDYLSNAKQEYRLKFLPDNVTLDQRYQQDDWPMMMY
jgi:hypothetical protein